MRGAQVACAEIRSGSSASAARIFRTQTRRGCSRIAEQFVAAPAKPAKIPGDGIAAAAAKPAEIPVGGTGAAAGATLAADGPEPIASTAEYLDAVQASLDLRVKPDASDTVWTQILEAIIGKSLDPPAEQAAPQAE